MQVYLITHGVLFVKAEKEPDNRELCLDQITIYIIRKQKVWAESMLLKFSKY